MYHSYVESSLRLCPEPEEGFYFQRAEAETSDAAQHREL